MSADNVIEIENVWKLFARGQAKAPRLTPENDDPGPDAFWALRDISLAVPRGQVMGLIGPNGAGKSTLLKILSRVSAPTRGCVRLRGSVVSLLEVGTGFHEDLSGRENIALNATILGMSEAELKRRFDEIVAFSGVEDFIDTPVKHFSSGMRVRLGFAIAVHAEPDVLIVDEVLAVGDAEFQEKCRQKVSEIVRAADRTVLIVSHSMSSIDTLCSRVALLEEGRLVRVGETQDVTDFYLDAIAQRAALLAPPVEVAAAEPNPESEIDAAERRERLALEEAERWRVAQDQWRAEKARKRAEEESRHLEELRRKHAENELRWQEKEKLRTRAAEEAKEKARLRAELESLTRPIIESDGSFDLQARDRRGNGAVRLQNLALCPQDGSPSARAGAGEPLTLKLRYSANIDAPGERNAGFNIVIVNAHDAPVFWLASSAAHDVNLPLRQSGEVVCRIPELPLLPASYKINVWVQLDGENADRIDHAADLTVTETAFFPTGRLQRNRYGDALVRHTWSF